MLNQVQLIGNLGGEPTVRTMQSGDKVVNFSLATSENYKDKTTGERKQHTQWHFVVIFDAKLIEVAEAYLKKGSKVYLQGMLQTREYTDQNGDRRWTTEVVLQRYRGVLTMLDTKRSGPPTVESAQEYGKVTTQEAPAPGTPKGDEEDIDIPF